MTLPTSPEINGAADSSPVRGNIGMPAVCYYIVDSFAPKHATGSKEVLSETGAAGGSINTADFVLTNVYYNPKVETGRVVVSVGQLARRGLAVELCGASCHIKVLNTGELVGKGRLREEDGFYHLDFLKIPKN